MLDLSVYLVLDPILCEKRGMVETAVEAADAGATVIQLRAPQWKKRAWYECALALKDALKHRSAQLIINDHVDIALAVDADGVHVGQSDMPVDVVRQMIGPGKILGLSASRTHHITEAKIELIDYFGVGPIFTTSTKPDADAPLGVEGFGQLARLSPIDCVAIGSVKAEHIPALVAQGAKGVAVVSAICGQEDSAAATRHLREVWDRAIG